MNFNRIRDITLSDTFLKYAACVVGTGVIVAGAAMGAFAGASVGGGILTAAGGFLGGVAGTCSVGLFFAKVLCDACDDESRSTPPTRSRRHGSPRIR